MSVRETIVLLVITFSLAGCVSTKRLPEPLPKGSRIAVISNFRDQALFQRAGTTTVDNASFYRHISGLKINPLITTVVANDLYKSRQFTVLPIYHHTNHDLLRVDVVGKKRHVSPQFQYYLSQLIARKKIDTIVLIVPDAIDFGNGQYFGSIWWAAGYGLFNRSFVFMQTSKVFISYKVYVINARTYQLWAAASGYFETKAHGLDVAWGEGYAGVTPNALNSIKQVIQKDMPHHLVSVVHKTGLP